MKLLSLSILLLFSLNMAFGATISKKGKTRGLLAHTSMHTELDKTLDEKTHSKAIAGNRVLLLNDGEMAFEKRMELVESAEHNIHFTALTWDANEAGQIFKDLFIRKAQEGVVIRVILDETSITGNLFYGKYNESRAKLVGELRAAGIDVILYNPPSIFAKLWSNTHEKFIIVDGKRAIAGGRNQGSKYFSYATDADVYMEGPAVKDLQDMFFRKWRENLNNEHNKWLKEVRYKIDLLVNRFPVKYRFRNSRSKPFLENRDLNKILENSNTVGDFLKRVEEDRNVSGGPIAVDRFKGEFTKMLAEMKWQMHMRRFDVFAKLTTNEKIKAKYYPSLGYKDSTRVRVVHHRPYEQKDNNIRDLYLTLIDRAQKRIVIQNAYFFPREKILNALIRAVKKRGVEVIIMTNSPETTDESKLKKYMRYPYLRLLEVNRRMAEEKVAIHELQPDPDGGKRLIHAKTMVIDDQFTLIGSYNLDRKSESYSSEHAVLIYGEDHAGKQMESYNDYLNSGAYKLFSLKELDRIRSKLLGQMDDEGLIDKITMEFL